MPGHHFPQIAIALARIFARWLHVGEQRNILAEEHVFRMGDRFRVELTDERDPLPHPCLGRPATLWGVPRNAASPAVVVTAYRPDPNRWTEDFVSRKS